MDEDAPTAPADSLARMEALVAASGPDVRTEGRAAGTRCRPRWTWPRPHHQEALTNVSRHSGAGAARLTVTHGSGKIVIRVEDDGPGATFTGGTGFGLQGMRERATALGGTLEAGPRPGGGFQVVAARYPLNAGPRSERSAMIRTVLADDQALVRAGFRALLERRAGHRGGRRGGRRRRGRGLARRDCGPTSC